MGVVILCVTHRLSAAASSGKQRVAKASLGGDPCQTVVLDLFVEDVDPCTLQLEIIEPDAAAHAVYSIELQRQQLLYAAVLPPSARSQP